MRGSERITRAPALSALVQRRAALARPAHDAIPRLHRAHAVEERPMQWAPTPTNPVVSAPSNANAPHSHEEKQRATEALLGYFARLRARLGGGVTRAAGSEMTARWSREMSSPRSFAETAKRGSTPRVSQASASAGPATSGDSNQTRWRFMMAPKVASRPALAASFCTVAMLLSLVLISAESTAGSPSVQV